jgi:hypothetical protein
VIQKENLEKRMIKVAVGEDGTAQVKRYVCTNRPVFDVPLSFATKQVKFASKLFVFHKFHRYLQQLFVRVPVEGLSN